MNAAMDGEDMDFWFFLFFILEDSGVLKKIIIFATWHTFGSHVASTSALNGFMDGKCNRCIILK